MKSKKKKQLQQKDSFPSVEKERFLSTVRTLAEPLCNAEGMELVFIEYQIEPSGRILRLYIDQPGGVNLDDCTNISRQLSDFLDVSLDSDEPYNLEVSSPGVNRPLGKLADYNRFKGQEAKIQVSEPVDGQKNFKGALMGAEDRLITILTNDKTVAIRFDTITKARLINYNGES
ncbi:MAG TPA: ribosome maturation factor RimP [Desulfobacteraceae bacterium]|nr:ribosome maturation factor RimP [Desulfobacteraceae bacterium]